MKVNARTITTEGPAGDDPRAVVVTLVLYGDEADALLSSFDPSSPSSPPAAECRTVARPIAEALAELVRP